ncbi:hypothetical protein H6785_01350 [Candidatus Nomurabacteria bacterium]|nr:hypothetical protein [Candidatus Kaiserbacteria bacterium]MCB9815216.1 hypothetical protein [Candidatus Nomurabacteria bacterium]
MRSLLTTSLLILTVFILVPQFVRAETAPLDDSEYRATLIKIIETLQSQIATLEAELKERQNVALSVYESTTPFIISVDVIRAYKVSGPFAVKYIQDYSHRKYFERVFDLLPNALDDKIKELVVFRGGNTDYDAFVETIPPNYEQWLYATNEDMLEDINSDSNNELITHEMAHIIAFEEVTGLPQPYQQNCEAYFQLNGCPEENSYLKQFINRFWSTADLQRAKQQSRSDNLLEDADNYFEKHQAEFVSGYAAISPEEDFAETFMFYVLGIGVSGEVAKQKIDFMGRYSYVRSLKAEILENI